MTTPEPNPHVSEPIAELFIAQQLAFALVVGMLHDRRLLDKAKLAELLRMGADEFSGVTADFLRGFAGALSRPIPNLRIIQGGQAGPSSDAPTS